MDLKRVKRNRTNIPIKTTASIWFIFPLNNAIPSHTTEITNGRRLIRESVICLFREKQAIPNIKAILEMFDPMTVPSDKAALSLKIPEIPMKISGAEVPNATRVNPMIKSLTPILLAMIDD